MNIRDSEFRKTIAARINNLRKSHRLSPKELADMVFISNEALEVMLRGKSIRAEHLRRLSEVFDIPLPDLIDSNVSLEYHSVFISYGGPDEAIAKRFYNFLKSKGVRCFFFPETATPGKRLHRTMSEGVNNYDRVLLLCSKFSLRRRGVLNELEQVLIREAAEGGSELLIPVNLDDYIFSSWKPTKPDIARQLKARVVADFIEAKKNHRKFRIEMTKIMKALLRNN